MNAYEEHGRKELDGQLTYFKYYIYTHWDLFCHNNKDITLYIRDSHDGQPICHKCHIIPHSPPKRFFFPQKMLSLSAFSFSYELRFCNCFLVSFLRFLHFKIWLYGNMNQQIHLLFISWGLNDLHITYSTIQKRYVW
jgi:hypothetical protein